MLTPGCQEKNRFGQHPGWPPFHWQTKLVKTVHSKLAHLHRALGGSKVGVFVGTGLSKMSRSLHVIKVVRICAIALRSQRQQSTHFEGKQTLVGVSFCEILSFSAPLSPLHWECPGFPFEHLPSPGVGNARRDEDTRSKRALILAHPDLHLSLSSPCSSLPFRVAVEAALLWKLREGT